MAKRWEKNWKQWQILFSWATKLLWTVTAATKLKDACSLEEKLWQNFVVVFQWLSCDWLFATPWTAECQASLSITISQSLLKLMSIECIILSKHLILCCLLLLPSSKSFPMSQLFASGSQSIGASASVLQSFQWIFRVDLLVVQWTLKNLLQHHNLKVLLHLVIFMI